MLKKFYVKGPRFWQVENESESATFVVSKNKLADWFEKELKMRSEFKLYQQNTLSFKSGKSLLSWIREQQNFSPNATWDILGRFAFLDTGRRMSGYFRLLELFPSSDFIVFLWSDWMKCWTYISIVQTYQLWIKLFQRSERAADIKTYIDEEVEQANQLSSDSGDLT